MKKIFNLPNIQKVENNLQKSSLLKKVLPELKPDTFEKASEVVQDKIGKVVNDMSSMQFTQKTYQLYPEDLEKIKQMPEAERPDFMRKLFNEGRYTEVFED